MSAEEWRVVPGFPAFEVSDQGVIRHVDTRRIKSQQLNPETNYLQVSLTSPGVKRATKPVHRVVGEAFLGPRPAGLETRHLNSDRFDNRAVNLQYGTHSENMRDQVRNGTHYEASKTECVNGHTLADAYVSGRGYRTCRTCDQKRHAAANAVARERRIAEGWDPDEYQTNRSGYWARRGAQRRSPLVKDECLHGHPMTLESGNLRIVKTSGARVCRACEAARVAKYRATHGRRPRQERAA